MLLLDTGGYHITSECRGRRFTPPQISNVTRLAPGLGGPALLTVLFLLCGFRLFGFLLPISFGLVFLTFLVAHRVTPFWCSPLHFAVTASSACQGY